MKVTGIISEFNPFHNGHKYLVEKARESGASHIVTVMGGSFMQRGECAVLGKFDRAEAAVRGGVDLVAELPQVYACASARDFAKGGVEILKACGCVSALCCGREETPSVRTPGAAMARAAELIESDIVKDYLSEGYSYPRAVCAAAEAQGDNEAAALLSSPNNVLAVEYFRAGKDIFDMQTVIRTAPHDGVLPCGDTISASAIRKMLLSGDDSYKKYVPAATSAIIERCRSLGSCPAALENNERGVLSVLRRMTADDLKSLPDVTEGLENRIYKAIRGNDPIYDIIMSVKSKRYTFARIKRIITCAYLGITKDDTRTAPRYIRVLAMNERGCDILREMKKTASLPVVMRAGDFEKLPDDARKMLHIDLRASDLFALCTPKILSCSADFYTSAVMIN